MARASSEAEILEIASLCHLADINGYNVDSKLGQSRSGVVFAGRARNDNNRPVALKLVRRDRIARWMKVHPVDPWEKPSPSEFAMACLVKNMMGVVAATQYFLDPTYVLYVFPRNPRTIGMKLFQEHVNIEHARAVLQQRNSAGGRDSGYDSNSEMNPVELVGRVRKVGMGEARACFLFRQVAWQQVDLFRLGVDHQDLRLQNLLVDPSTGGVSLIDFAKAKFVQRGECTGYTGCPHYTPPEFLLTGAYTAEDRIIWSLGLILLSFLTGISPGQLVTRELYEGNMAWSAREKVVELEARLNRVIRHLPARFTKARDLLARCLARDPAHRIRLAQIMNHPWLVDGAYIWLQLPPTE